MENLFIIATTILVTAVLTFIATFHFIILNQEITQNGNEYEVTILNNVYYYE